MIDILQQEQRHIRQRLKIATHVYTTDGTPYGRLIDINERGFIVERNVPAAMGDYLLATLPIPSPGGMQNLELTTKCYACHSAENESLFHVSFQITEISDQDQVALNYFIRDF